MNRTRDFIIKLLILTLTVGLIGTVLFLTALEEYYLPVFPYLLAFFALLTFSFHWILVRTLEKNPNKFSYVFMGLSAGKLFIMMIFIVAYLIFRRDTVISFLLGTFMLYLVFTFFEVKTLLRLVQGKQ